MTSVLDSTVRYQRYLNRATNSRYNQPVPGDECIAVLIYCYAMIFAFPSFISPNFANNPLKFLVNS